MYHIVHDPEAVKKILSKIHVGTVNTLKNRVGEAGNFAVRVGQENVHVITGHTKRNIQQQTVSDDEVKVLSKSIYSGWENRRGGDHAFFDKLVAETKRQFPDLVISDIVHVIRKAKIT